MLEDNQIYIVADMEADGPVPGLYSMLSLAAVATNGNEELGTFYQKLLPLDGASQEPSTMAWWRTQPEAWKEVTTDAEPAEKVMHDFAEWVHGLQKQPLFVSHPVALDYTFTSWYLWKFVGSNPFTDENGATMAADISSFIAGKFGLTYSASKRSKLPAWMLEGMPEHSHNSLDDVRGYATLLRNVLKR